MLNIQNTELYTKFIVPFDEEFIKKSCEKRANIISKSEAPAPEEIEVQKHRRDTACYTSYFSSSTGETGLTGGTRVSLTPGKRIPKKKKNINPYLCLHFFLKIKDY